MSDNNHIRDIHRIERPKPASDNTIGRPAPWPKPSREIVDRISQPAPKPADKNTDK